MINGIPIETGDEEAVAVSPAVALQLSVDSCARKFVIRDSRIDGIAFPQFARLLSGSRNHLSHITADSLRLLLGRLWNHNLELEFFPVLNGGPSVVNLISLLSVDALNSLLTDGLVGIKSEDALLATLLNLGLEYRPLLRHVKWGLLSPAGVASAIAALPDILPSESAWPGIRDCLFRLVPLEPGPFNSVIVSELPEIFAHFNGKRFALLWRGSLHGFEARDFHRCCDGHPNTLTLVLDTKGNIFGGFTPVKWDSEGGNFADRKFRADRSCQSFLFTLKNAHNYPPREFRLKSWTSDSAVCCDRSWGPHFCELGISDCCNTNAGSFAGDFTRSYVNDTGIEGRDFFSGSTHFRVNEIEVFEIIE